MVGPWRSSGGASSRHVNDVCLDAPSPPQQQHEAGWSGQGNAWPSHHDVHAALQQPPAGNWVAVWQEPIMTIGTHPVHMACA